MIISRRNTTCRMWLRGPVLGLVVVVVLIAHDVAMTGAETISPGQHARSGLGGSAHHLDDGEYHDGTVGHSGSDVARGDDDVPRVTDPNRHHGDCGIPPEVVTFVDGARRFSDRERSVSIDVPAYPSVSAPEVRRDAAPTRSPTVRRALIQVYRM